MNIAIIGVPVDLGAGRRGVDMGPSAIRYAGLATQLRALGYTVTDMGNVSVPLAEALYEPAADDKLRYLQALIDINRELTAMVQAACQNQHFPLILGGDHSLSIGSVRGVAYQRKIGLIWIDAHGDFNTDQTTPSGNIHGMSLAALTGRGHAALAAPIIADTNVVLVGARDVDEQERVLLRESGVQIFSMHDIDRLGMAAVMERAIQAASQGTQGFHVSLDLDALDPDEAPGVGTPVTGGLTYREAHLAMELIASSHKMLGLDLVEVNPILDSHNRTAERAVQFALSGLGKRIV